MKRIIRKHSTAIKALYLIFLCLMTGLSVFAASTLKLTIGTGRHNGTYYAIAESLSSVMSKKDVRISVKESAGSLQNVIDLTSGAVDLGLAQLDVLALLSKMSEQNDKSAKDALNTVSLLFPLYSEQVHVVVRKDLVMNSLKDARGRRVEMGEKNSGSYITADVMLLSAGVDCLKECTMMNSAPDDALQNVMDGKADLMFYTAGAPAGVFKKLKAPAGKKIKLASFSEADLKMLSGLYHTAAIPSDTYAWMDGDVTTPGIWAVLLATSRLSQKDANDFVWNLVNGLPDLERQHRKWTDVKLDALQQALSIKGLKMHPGLQQWASEYQKKSGK